MLAALARFARRGLSDRSSPCCGSVVANARCTSSTIRKRRKRYFQALNNSHTHPGTLAKLREKAATPANDLLRYIAENKIAKAVTQADRRQLWFDVSYKKYAPVFLGQFKPRMRFWTAALNEGELPLARLPEIAIAGRSNSGKSTLVNYLCGRHSAKVKREPGSTTEIVFWQIGRPAQLCLVDLPGYGFATAPEETRLQWTEFTLWYVRSRRNLRRVLVLLDARFGLKPADKEMIAYLERHNVSWHAVVTKTDKVRARDLACKLTLLKEDTKQYKKMVGDPIPISALKRKGMEKLRSVLNHLKVQKEVVKEGIKQNVYDLLEERRIRRAEKARKKREQRRAEAERTQAEELVPNMAGADGDNDAPAPGVDAARSGDASELHITLEDYYSGAVGDDRGQHGPAEAAQVPADPGAQDALRSPAAPPGVRELHYATDGRDSERIEGFMRQLYSDAASRRTLAADVLPDPASGVRDAAKESLSDTRRDFVHEGELFPRFSNVGARIGGDDGDGVSTGLLSAAAPSTNKAKSAANCAAEGLRVGAEDVWPSRILTGPSSVERPSVGRAHFKAVGPLATMDSATRRQGPGEASRPGLGVFAQPGEDSDDDAEDGPHVALPPVMRFEPTLPTFAEPSSAMGPRLGKPSGTVPPASSETASSAFPGLPTTTQAPSPERGVAPGGRRQELRLRRGWHRPSRDQDRIYEADDFVSAEEYAHGFRPRAPPAPTPETAGELLVKARQRYEREWAFELDDVEPLRMDVSSAADGRARIAATSAATRTQPVLEAERVKSEKRGRFWYISKRGREEVPVRPGRTKTLLLGRPPARILKQVRQKDIAKTFNLGKDRTLSKRRNFGDNLTEEEAKSKWAAWYLKQKRKHPERIRMAEEEMREAAEEGEASVDTTHARRPYRTRPGPRGGSVNPEDDNPAEQ
mmetsp:Transcript_40244/g.110679  ORF Transcript_40244/g.110679 Transcript_40244/m.110679 type:complete len:924 (-) Transcript_40244:66-2837(-)